MSPGMIGRAGRRSASAAELWNPAIENRRTREVTLENIGGELRQTPRTRKTPHIRHELDVVRHEDASKLVAGARRVTDCPNNGGHIRIIADGGRSG